MNTTPTVTPELIKLLRQVKLGRCLDTLPERLALATTTGLGHGEFLELVLADEVARRETSSASLRARNAGLDPAMTLDRWDDTAQITYDRNIWNELCSLRFVESGHNALILGPVGVGKTFLATALGHAAVRRRFSVHFERCVRLLKRLRASRLDNSHDTEIRKLLRVDLLVIDDFALTALDTLDTADVYELIVERHRAAATVVTSNRTPIEWLGLMADRSSPNQRSTGSSPPPTNSSATASPTVNANDPPPAAHLTHQPHRRDHHDADADTPDPVPSHWRSRGPITLAGDRPPLLVG